MLFFSLLLLALVLASVMVSEAVLVRGTGGWTCKSRGYQPVLEKMEALSLSTSVYSDTASEVTC